MENYAIVLAAGKGTRMQSDKPKVIHEVCGMPMINIIQKEFEEVLKSKDNIIYILGYKKEEVIDKINNSNYLIQKKQLGTGHAVKSAKDFFQNKEGNVLIISGDTPLLRKETLKNVIDFHNNNKSVLTVISSIEENPYGYGRIVKNQKGKVIKIVEEKDADESEKTIKEINSGIYLIKIKELFENIENIENKNNSKEYYLTDIVEIFVKKHYKVLSYQVDKEETLGVNDLKALSKANTIMQKRIIEELLEKNVYIENENTTIIDLNSKVENGVKIKGFSKIINSNIASNSVIESSTIINSRIEKDNNINNSYIIDSQIMNNNQIGPFTQIRNNTKIQDNNRIGNFVEIKKSKIGNENKIAHLSYIGDSIFENNINIGAGTITVNYDGKNKYKTEIKSNAFIGSGSKIIAPSIIEKGVKVAAGTIIDRKEISKNSLVIGRVKETIKENYYNDKGEKNNAK